jgi:hypothetical protein
MKRALTRPQFRKRVLVASQTSLLTDEVSNAVAMDFVGRYESLQRDCDHICSVLSVPGETLSIKNSSQHKTYSEVLDDELRQALLQMYADDFEAFNYDP